MKQYNRPLEELLEDWQHRATWGDQENKIEYLNKMNDLERDQEIDGFRVQAYITDEGDYDYYLKIV